MSLRGALDLEGRIVIKVQLGNDVRKMLIHNDDITYDELALMMQRIYKGAIKQDDELTIKYKDEDGDLITIFDSSDVSFAIQTCNRQLKLVIYVNGLERNFDDSEVATVKRGLCDVRDMVNNLLDQINAKTLPSDRLASTDDIEESAVSEEPPVANSLTAAAPVIDSKEFDPLDVSHSATTQLDSVAGGDKSASHSQYGGSQYGSGGAGGGGSDQVTKSFDQMSMSDRQSINQSPVPTNMQSSFGNAFNANPSQQQPVSTSQQINPYPSQAPVQSSSAGYSPSSGYNYSNATSQYATSQVGVQPPTSQQQPQQQQFNYAQSWQQQNPSQQQLSQTQQMPHAQQVPPAQPMTSSQQQAPQQMPPQQQYGGYGMPGQLPPQQQQNIYGQPPQPTPNNTGYGGGSPNPYSKPGQIRGAYPRATGAYPQLPQTGQRPAFPPPQ